jgi:hypothetical protein
VPLFPTWSGDQVLALAALDSGGFALVFLGVRIVRVVAACARRDYPAARRDSQFARWRAGPADLDAGRESYPVLSGLRSSGSPRRRARSPLWST